MEPKMAKEIKERPILFSGEMVRAILDGRKTQTRRVIKMPKWIEQLGGDLERGFADKAFGVTPCLQVPCSEDESVQRLRNPWMWSDEVPVRLWVREKWRAYEPQERRFGGTGMFAGAMMRVYANPPIKGESIIVYGADDPYARHTWMPSIHMPRWMSRINLEITNVRAERLNEISDEDALAEGAPETMSDTYRVRGGAKREYDIIGAAGCFSALWHKINGKKYPWSSNPWVWVIEFKKV